MKKTQENLFNDAAISESAESKIPAEVLKSGELRSLEDLLNSVSSAINSDSEVRESDLEKLRVAVANIKIDVGGEMVTVEESEKIPDLKMNMEIWKEMSEGNFENTNKLTKITKRVSRYLNASAREINLNELTSAKGLELPVYLPGNLRLDGLTSAKDLHLPVEIGGSLFLNGISSAEGLVLPKHVGRRLYLAGLTTAVGLVLPEKIDGSLILNGLTSDEGLVLPDIIGGKIDLPNMNYSERESLRKRYPQHSDKIE